MGSAIGQVLPLAVGVALSPLPIIAVVLMLTTPRARTNGPAFVLGWLAGLGVVGAVVLLVAGPHASSGGSPATWVSWLKLVLGLGVLVVAVRNVGKRPHGDEQPEMPKWMGAIDRFGPGRAIGTAAVLAGVNPKNLLLAVAAAAAVAQTGIPGGQQVVAYLVFAVIGTLGVGLPVVVYLTMGERAPVLLGHLKTWLGRNNAVILAVLCAVIGVKLVGDAISGFAG